MVSVQVPSGFQLKERLESAPESQVYIASGFEDARMVILKSYAPGPEGDSRIEREFELLRRLAGTGTPAALELLSGTRQTGATLVLEYVSGVSLRAWAATAPVTLEAFLIVAQQLAKTLARVHRGHVIHGDLNPDNILIDPQSRSAWLLDFGAARPITESSRAGISSHGSRLRGLAYVSPEFTGRMDRGVDSRSDLYSLGTCFYHALTGEPPFLETDALALIHAHFAKCPEPPCDRRRDLPSAVSDLVLKLLAKSPEDRYQTAQGLQHDIEMCLEDVRSTGSIRNSFQVGEADVPHRPLFPHTLYGREREVRALSDAFARARAGVANTLWIRGDPGCGKSALIRSLRTAISESQGHLIAGEFDACRRDVPYAAFSQAFEMLLDQMLTESDETLSAWRSSLRDALGTTASALLDLAPSLELVLGEDLPALPKLGPKETRGRLSVAVERLVDTLSAERPLVMVLENLQWADAASRQLLRELVLHMGSHQLLVIGTFRDLDVPPEHPLARLLAEFDEHACSTEFLHVAPLDATACAAMISAALGASTDAVALLTDAITRKSGGIPLAVEQCVQHLFDTGLLRFELRQGWTWNPAEIEAADIPDEAAGLMLERLRRLGAESRQVLEVASCAGHTFDAAALIEISELPGELVESGLRDLTDVGLLAPAPGRGGLRFAHGRIREAAQKDLAPEQRAQLHYRVACLLLARTPSEALPERVLEIADHLSLGRERIGADFRGRATSIYLMAGKRALAAGAGATASRHLRSARSCFTQDDWNVNPELGFDLHLSSVEAAYQSREVQCAEELLDELEKHPLSRLQEAMLTASRISLMQLDQTDPKRLQLVLGALRRFGVHWPVFPSRLRTRLTLAWTDWLFSGALDEAALRPATPDGDQSGWLAPLIIISAGGGAMSEKSVRLMCLSTSFALRTARRYGYVRPPAVLFASYAGFRLGYLRQLQGAERYAQAAEYWNERAPHVLFGPRAQHLVYAFVRAWTRPRREVLEPLREASEHMLERGDLEYAYYASLQCLSYTALCGDSLGSLEQKWIALGARHLRPTAAATAVLRELQNPEADVTWLREQVGALQLSNYPTSDGAMQPWAFWLGVLCLLGSYEEVCAVRDAVDEHLQHVGCMLSQVVDGEFFSGIARGASAGSSLWSRRLACRKLRRHLRRVEVWAREGPDFRHMVLGLEAELARLRRKPRAALERYASAARAAELRGYNHHAALLLDRSARLLAELGRPKEAARQLDHSIQLYQQWGAEALAAGLRRGGVFIRAI